MYQSQETYAEINFLKSRKQKDPQTNFTYVIVWIVIFKGQDTELK